jgi:uncharacterized protein
MSTTTVILLILIGLAAGVLSGLVGVGGGIIMVPALVLVLGFTQKQAQGTSLGIMLLPVGILAVLQYYKQGYLDFKTVFIIAGAFVVGGFFGSKIALNISDDKMKKVFGVVLLLVSFKILFFDKPAKKQPVLPEKAVVENVENKKG